MPDQQQPKPLRCRALATDYDGTIAHDGMMEPGAITALERLRESGRDLIMVTRRELDQLIAVCERLNLIPANVVGVGDAENDHAFIKTCGIGVAVANAIPSLKKEVAIVTKGERGEGVSELIDRIIATDLADIVVRSHAAASAPAA